MTSLPSAFRGLGHSAFRVVISLESAFFVLWITVVGFLALLADPYLTAAYWFLGLLGLFACAGACLSTRSRTDGSGLVANPVRAMVCLTLAGAIGVLFWTQAKPAMATKLMGLEILGILLTLALFLGIAGIFIFLLLLLFARVMGKEEQLEGQASSP